MRLYRTAEGYVVERDGRCHAPGATAPGWDELVSRDDLLGELERIVETGEAVAEPAPEELRAPIGSQEVWAAGVTYYRSREARMKEGEATGGASFYDRVYEAPRPELFFKATANRVVGPNERVAVRKDSRSSVPEPELALLVTPNGKITGYTVGNDLTARDLEGENPLYLPQAKIWDRCCALGPCVLVQDELLPASTEIRLEILRGANVEFEGTTSLGNLKREPAELVEYLFRQNTFPNGCFLLTGTGIVPPDSFALRSGDEIRITIAEIGTLVNVVE